LEVVVVAWPSGPLESAALRRAGITARALGHEVTEIDLLAEGFAAAMTTEERAAYHEDEPVVGDVIARHVAIVRQAEALIFVYPTMASTLPPPLRGWLERVMLPGVAFVFDPETERVKPGLTRVGRILGIATYPETWPVVKAQHDNGRRILLRALRLNTGFRTRTRWVPCYSAPAADEIERNKFLARVEGAVASL